MLVCIINYVWVRYFILVNIILLNIILFVLVSIIILLVVNSFNIFLYWKCWFKYMYFYIRWWLVIDLLKIIIFMVKIFFFCLFVVIYLYFLLFFLLWIWSNRELFVSGVSCLFFFCYIILKGMLLFGV